MKKSYIVPKVNMHLLRCESMLQTISPAEGETTVPNDFDTDIPEVGGESGTGDGMND